jgi:hypothetical protein
MDEMVASTGSNIPKSELQKILEEANKQLAEKTAAMKAEEEKRKAEMALAEREAEEVKTRERAERKRLREQRAIEKAGGSGHEKEKSKMEKERSKMEKERSKVEKERSKVEKERSKVEKDFSIQVFYNCSKANVVWEVCAECHCREIQRSGQRRCQKVRERCSSRLFYADIDRAHPSEQGTQSWQNSRQRRTLR